MADYTKQVRKILSNNGFIVARKGKGDHVIWYNDVTKRTASVDGEIKSRHSANEILKKAGLGKYF
ncbi:MAG: type II toxin-antitoxin system HicA family toxin [Defluviitaleaceae bacterium]|nr:type II toxin-antitoxin system HicA family toxin [Defluviitaleaceae bacterium]